MKNISKYKNIGLLIVLISLLAFSTIVLTKEGRKGTDPCPEDFTSDIDIDSEIQNFITKALAEKPDSTVEELGIARLDYLEKNYCSETLRSIKERGGKAAYVESLKWQASQE